MANSLRDPRLAGSDAASDALPSTWKSRIVYDLARSIAAPILTLGWSFRFEGCRHIPQSGPVLVIANHQSFFDPPLVGIAFGRRLVFLARKTLFKKPAFAALIRSLNAVPIDQEGVGKEGIRTVIEQLQLGKAVLVFPEGTRTPDGSIRPLQAGIQLLIKRTSAPIVPVGIAGAYDAWPIWRKYPIPSPLFLPSTPRTIAVSIGPPLEAARFARLPREESLAALEIELAKVHARAEKLRRK